MEISIDSIKNPSFEGMTDPFEISIFDSIRNHVLYSSYFNLNDLRLQFQYPGP